MAKKNINKKVKAEEEVKDVQEPIVKAAEKTAANEEVEASETVVEKPTEEVADEALSLGEGKVEAENNQDEEPSGANDDDIEAAPKFWEKMSAGNNASSNDFFSTHPCDAKRIEALKEALP